MVPAITLEAIVSGFFMNKFNNLVSGRFVNKLINPFLFYKLLFNTLLFCKFVLGHFVFKSFINTLITSTSTSTCSVSLRTLLILPLLIFPVSLFASSTGLVVTGLGGNEEYAEQFSEYGNTVVEALRTISSEPENFELLEGDAVSRQSIMAAIERKGAKASDTFFLFLIGHGTVDSQSWRFNIPGRDITTGDIIEALNSVSASSQMVMLGTSASGAALDILSQPGRLVVTATKSGGELNVVRFPQFFAEAMASVAADTDRNEMLTLAEAWKYANDKTQAYYTDLKLLASEHARIAGDNPQQLSLARLGALRLAGDDPIVAKLLEKRLLLENEFGSLRNKKASMDTLEYYEQLEPLLVKIALLQQEIDTATGWSASNE